MGESLPLCVFFSVLSKKKKERSARGGETAQIAGYAKFDGTKKNAN